MKFATTNENYSNIQSPKYAQSNFGQTHQNNTGKGVLSANKDNKLAQKQPKSKDAFHHPSEVHHTKQLQ